MARKLKPVLDKPADVKTLSVVEENAENAPVKDIKWEGSQINTEQIQINDPYTGGEVVLRHFFFKSQPRPKEIPQPSKLEVISYYKRMIEMMLWGDGLIIREDKPIELHELHTVKGKYKSLYYKMLEEGADFVILCLAEPRRGVQVYDKAHRV